MRIFQLEAPGIDNLVRTEQKDGTCEPGPGEICVRLRAASLNFHDYAVVAGFIPVAPNRIPLSDAAGEVIACGGDVTAFAPGDRVMTTFYPAWQDGRPAPHLTRLITGDRNDGYARDMVCAPESWFTKAPAGYSHEEAATLPCAALTAWRSLMEEGQLKSGDTVLVQGTGGVSLFAVQLAKNAGARVIATSSSDAKLARAQALGADHVINYRTDPQWGVTAKEITGGEGVDHVIEVGGPQTLDQSIAACRVGGHIALIGVLTGVSGEVPTAEIFKSQLKISGIGVGNRRQQQDMVRALEASDIRPVIDRAFDLDDIQDAFRHLESQTHFGKIVLTF